MSVVDTPIQVTDEWNEMKRGRIARWVGGEQNRGNRDAQTVQRRHLRYPTESVFAPVTVYSST